MDWSWLASTANLVIGVAAGVIGKVIYDRRFAKQPDLRYALGTPATFGSGDRETVYQNLEISNSGTDTTTDVRINFSLPAFDLVDHQISYDGPHSLEKSENRVSITIPSLPPGDSLTLSFTFSPAKSNVNKIDSIFLSTQVSGRTEASS